MSNPMRPALGMSVLLILWMSVEATFFHATVKSLDARSWRVLQSIASRVLQHAHRINDDLTMQELIQGIAQAPGILSASLVDPDGKVLADSQLERLGQSFKNIDHKRWRTWQLDDGKAHWATLFVQMSSRAATEREKHHLLVMVTGVGFISGAAFLIMWRQKRYDESTERRRQDLEVLCRFKDEELGRLAEIQLRQIRAIGMWLEAALEQVPQPALLLDRQQRIVSFNGRAKAKLAPGTIVSGQSWHDVPTLAGFAGTLQQSLESPGCRIKMTQAEHSLEFLSEPASAGSGGTWVFWSDIIRP